ncbi:putative knottin, scorpion toxin-like superfamily [Arabidopsis thaliana]
MVSSRKCLFLVFLCLVVLLIPKSTSAKYIVGKKPLLIGTCIEFPTEKCNKTCIESNFAGENAFILVKALTLYVFVFQNIIYNNICLRFACVIIF